jgi:hypothetical protein
MNEEKTISEENTRIKLMQRRGVVPSGRFPISPITISSTGHFAAWEQPQLFSDEVRAGFRSLRIAKATTLNR